MSLKNILQSKKNFWTLILSIWLISTLVDRIWWNFFSTTPSWDQADYLNSALDHARALSLVEGGEPFGFKSLLDLSPKIPPLASILNGLVISFFGDTPHKAAWSLSLWNGFLIFNMACWGLYLKGKRYSFICVLITSLSPFLFQLRTDYVLELPLISATTFYLFHFGRWSSPYSGGKWIQVIISSIACAASLLIKQSSLLVIFPSIVFVFIVSFKRNNIFRLQLFFFACINLFTILPWFYHNWIMTLSGTYRAVFESARLEGDPSIFDFKSIFWYFPFLNIQFGNIIFFIGISGLVLIILGYIRSLKFPINFKNIFAINNYKWSWIVFNLSTTWILTTLIPNKDIRYISSTIPLIILLFALGFYEWGHWINLQFKFKFNSLLLVSSIGFSFLYIFEMFGVFVPLQSKYYPVNEIISEVKSRQDKYKKDTVIVVPSTPELNQHNVSYFGRMKGGNILGRQLGQSLSHKQAVLNQSNWIVLAEGNQGSVPKNSIALDQAIRASGFFEKIREFPRKEGGSYSLWKRNSSAPKSGNFYNRFIELANGMEKGPSGVKLIFDEIAIHHMIDGHFNYQQRVKDEALSKIISDPKNKEALWTLSLLMILSNRPYEADIHLEKLENLIPDNPWPSAYRSVVNLASWNPWKASKIADIAFSQNKNIVLKALGDTSGVLGGDLTRLSSSLKSVPKALKNAVK